MTVAELLEPLAFTLNDESHVTYPVKHLLSAINNGCRMIAILRPDASTETEPVTLKAGALQHLPDKAQRLLQGCYRMEGEQPTTPLELVNRSDLDRLDPGWQNREATEDVQELMYDERFPKTYWCYPPAVEGLQLQLSFSVMPKRVASEDDDFPLSEKYIPVVIEWVLYLMWSRDAENSMNQQRASEHRNQFYAMLQIKTQADQMVSPINEGVEG